MATTIFVVCDNCGNRMEASSEFVGRKGRCPKCRNLVMIEATGVDQSAATLQPVGGDSQAARPAYATTSVPGWLAGLLGLGATAVLYLAVFLPLRSQAIGQLFMDRGPIPPITTFVTCWGLATLVLKYLAVRKQLGYAELELDMIPLEVGVQITPTNVDQFMMHLANLPTEQRTSILGRRISGALEHFRSRNSVPEVQEYLSAQAEIDSSQVDSGYTILRAFVWAVPIFGFIGTVMGISGAVEGLNVSIADQSGGEALMEGMKQVTSGLATAFDTTLVALCMAIVLLFPTEALRKTEYGMLDRIESFANDSILRRMSDENPDDKMPEVVRHALEAAFAEHQRWLVQWQSQVAQLGEVIGGDFEVAFSKVHGKLQDAEASRFEKIAEMQKVIDNLFSEASEVSKSRAQMELDVAGNFQRFVEVGQQLQRTLEENVKHCREFLDLHDKVGDAGPNSAVVRQLGALEAQLGQLTKKLGLRDTESYHPRDGEGQPSVDETLSMPPKRRVFGDSSPDLT